MHFICTSRVFDLRKGFNYPFRNESFPAIEGKRVQLIELPNKFLQRKNRDSFSYYSA